MSKWMNEAYSNVPKLLIHWLLYSDGIAFVRCAELQVLIFGLMSASIPYAPACRRLLLRLRGLDANFEAFCSLIQQ